MKTLAIIVALAAIACGSDEITKKEPEPDWRASSKLERVEFFRGSATFDVETECPGGEFSEIELTLEGAHNARVIDEGWNSVRDPAQGVTRLQLSCEPLCPAPLEVKVVGHGDVSGEVRTNFDLEYLCPAS